MLWKKYRLAFDGISANIPIASKKKYRLSHDELLTMRNQCALWQQLRPFLETRASNINCVEYESSLITSQSRDEDMQHLIQSCPRNISPSMLPSQKKLASQHVVDQQAQRLTCVYGFHGFIVRGGEH